MYCFSQASSGEEILLYRTSIRKRLCFSSRPAPTQPWGEIMPTAIPDDVSNYNAGRLPDGRTFLAHNPVVASPKRRDPLVLSLSDDGFVFDRAHVLASCYTPPFSRPGQSDGCRARHAPYPLGGAPGPQYPQVVVDAARAAVYVAFANNKEDIWVKTLALGDL